LPVPTTTFILCLAALLLGSSLLGVILLRKAPAQEKTPRLTFLLLAVGTLLLLSHFSLEPAWSSRLDQPAWAALHLLSPFILGGLAWLVSRLYAALGHAGGKPLGQPERLNQARPWLFVTILALMAVFLVQPYGLLAALLPGAFLLMSLWFSTRSKGAPQIVIACLVLVLLGVARSGMLEPMLAALPEWVGLLLRPIFFILAAIVSLYSAFLGFHGLEGLITKGKPETTDECLIRRFSAVLRLGLAAVLLVALVLTVFWDSSWDLTDDGLGGIWMVITSSLGAIAAGGFLIERYRGRLRFMGIVFLLLVPSLNLGAFALGIRYPYLQDTAQRAKTIQHAVERYYNRIGGYPTAQEDLVPRDLMWVPRQLILRGEDWCYQGGRDFYRLGVFWRLTFSSMLSIEEYARAGSPPDQGWVCQENLVRMKFKYDPPIFFDGGQ
jgi:hypothetical protein